MPRGEARIRVTIWDDEDYTSLPMDAQWLYEALLSQKTLDHAGVLTIPRREWSNLCSDEDAADRIARARKTLEDRRYVVVDDNTDELLVRSYIRRDVESAPPGTFRSAMNSAVAVSSPRLKAVLYAELRRLDTAVVEKKGMANGERPIDALNRALDALRPGPDDPGSRPVEEPRPDLDRSHEHGMRIEQASDAESSPSIQPTWHAVSTGGGGGGGGGGSCPVTTQDPIKETLSRVRAKAHLPADVRSAYVIGETVPRGIGRGTRGDLTSRIKHRYEDGIDDEPVVLGLVRWAENDQAPAGAIEWMIDDAVKSIRNRDNGTVSLTAFKAAKESTTDRRVSENAEFLAGMFGHSVQPDLPRSGRQLPGSTA